MHKINISELKPGMVIIDPKLSWVISPYLYTVPGPVDSEEAIAKIASEGFLEAYIQDERDIDPLPQPATPELRPDSTLPKRVSELPAVKRGGFAPPPPQVELAARSARRTQRRQFSLPGNLMTTRGARITVETVV